MKFSDFLAFSIGLSMGLAKIGTGTFLLTGVLSGIALADPPPLIELPVFCFRFTDIEATSGDSFRFEFEVLNWTD